MSGSRRLGERAAARGPRAGRGTAVPATRAPSGTSTRRTSLQELRHGTGHDPLGEPLDDGRLADPGGPEQHRVALLGAQQRLDDPLRLLLATEDRRQHSLAGERRQVPTDLVEQRCGGRGRGGWHDGADGAGTCRDDVDAGAGSPVSCCGSTSGGMTGLPESATRAPVCAWTRRVTSARSSMLRCSQPMARSRPGADVAAATCGACRRSRACRRFGPRRRSVNPFLLCLRLSGLGRRLLGRRRLGRLFCGLFDGLLHVERARREPLLRGSGRWRSADPCRAWRCCRRLPASCC